ncbi:hypothetical protein M885DRAFT_541035 [Pelagophyceae sp. CCMP2097]|nr:hypothetical protein M885DRAFT_541035 [Pelagophyceae sp. CCMP2097]
MQLLVRADQTFVVDVAADATLEDFAAMVAARTHDDDAALTLNGAALSGLRLSDVADLVDGCTITVAPRLRGGALLGKPVKGRSKGLDFEEKFMRQREYDAQNQKYQVARNELKARMEQEKVNSRMNRLKIQNQWRKIMRLAKVESLRKGIEVLSQNHERDVDRKDAIIQMLDRDLEEAEDQFRTALRAHLQNMDELVDLQDGRLLTSEQEFESELKTLEQEFAAEREAILKQHAAETTELQDVMAAVDSEEQEREAEAKQEHEGLREEIRNKNLEEINMLRIGLDSQIEDLEQHFETAHLNYLQTTDQRTHDFKFYTKKDQELSKEIETKIRKIERLQASLQHWRTKLQQNMRECAQRNALLADEKNKIQGHFQQLKSRMDRFRGAQGRRLEELTQHAHACKSTIAGRIALAERILGLAELARKMETEQEKIIPFETFEAPAVSAPSPPNSADDASVTKAKPAEEAGRYRTASLRADGTDVPEWCHLDNFLRKYNKVLLDKLAVEKERERLERENADLQALLKQFFDGVTVNDAVMQGPNPLLVINGNLNIQRPAQVRQDLTVVDGNHMVATSRVNTSYF